MESGTQTLPKNTPRMTVPIESVIIRFTDGSVKKIESCGEDGSAFYRESFFSGEKEAFATYETFIAKGVVKDIQGAK